MHRPPPRLCCIVCSKQLDAVHAESKFQPNGAVICETSGNYGSTVFDPMGIKGEPSAPDDPAHGLVWSAILGQIDRANSESEFVSVADTPRTTFAKHPWSIGGGGAAELREEIEDQSHTLKSIRADLGFFVITGEDNCLMLPTSAVTRLGFAHAMPIGEVDVVRDWRADSALSVLWPYSTLGADISSDKTESHVRGLWTYRTSLKDRKVYRFYPTEHDAIVAFKRGEVDVLEDIQNIEDLSEQL